MAIRVVFFAAVREALGLAEETLVSSAPTVAALRAELIARGQPWAGALDESRALRCAVNQHMAQTDAAIVDGDEVAFFPPVTGG